MMKPLMMKLLMMKPLMMKPLMMKPPMMKPLMMKPLMMKLPMKKKKKKKMMTLLLLYLTGLLKTLMTGLSIELKPQLMILPSNSLSPPLKTQFTNGLVKVLLLILIQLLPFMEPHT